MPFEACNEARQGLWGLQDYGEQSDGGRQLPLALEKGHICFTDQWQNVFQTRFGTWPQATAIRLFYMTHTVLALYIILISSLSQLPHCLVDLCM